MYLSCDNDIEDDNDDDNLNKIKYMNKFFKKNIALNPSKKCYICERKTNHWLIVYVRENIKYLLVFYLFICENCEKWDFDLITHQNIINHIENNFIFP